jgi:hypothetical protein
VTELTVEMVQYRDTKLGGERLDIPDRRTYEPINGVNKGLKLPSERSYPVYHLRCELDVPAMND